MKSKDAIEHVRDETHVPPGFVGWFRATATSGEFQDPDDIETAPQGAKIATDLMVDSNGALAPGVAIRDADGTLLAGVLLDPIEATRHGAWMLDAGRRAMDRYCSWAEDDRAMRNAFDGHLLSLFNETFQRIAKEQKAEAERKALQAMEIRSLATIEALKTKAKGEVYAEVRANILLLAKAAATVDDAEQVKILKTLMPWIIEIQTEHG